MSGAESNADLYSHVRVIVGIVLGLSIARLLNGIAGLVQHPDRERIWWVHLGWVAWTLLSVIAFWWWEFHLADIQRWTFPTYVFVLLYASAYFLLCALLFPTDMGEYAGLRDYFMSKRGWIFGLLAAITLMDVLDTRLKGEAYFHSMGAEYAVRTVVLTLLCLAAMRISRPAFHAAFVIAALAYQVLYLIRYYDVLL